MEPLGRRSKDLTGQTFGHWTVLRFAAMKEYGRIRISQWFCRCSCGREKVLGGPSLRNGCANSCGCVRRKHGHTTQAGRSPTYNSWYTMIARCTYPSNPAYEHYKKRGITVCERWRKFENFLADMGERPDGTTLDRKDNDRGYEPDNCRWATKKEQGNNRVTNVHYEFRGERLTLAQLLKYSKVSKDTLRARLRRRKEPWPIDAALNTPPQQGLAFRKPYGS
jgi:hypothetical protein